MKIKRRTLSVILSLGIIILVSQFYGFTPKTNDSNAIVQEHKWKNLKVLPQDITKDSLMALMHGYENALSVGCDHCHAPRKDNPEKLDFASDEKIEKEIARGMINMTNEINANYFQPHFPDPKPAEVFVVNCVMCHRGTVNPELYLSKMGSMYKTYKEGRDNRKEMILEQMEKK